MPRRRTYECRFHGPQPAEHFYDWDKRVNPDHPRARAYHCRQREAERQKEGAAKRKAGKKPAGRKKAAGKGATRKAQARAA